MAVTQADIDALEKAIFSGVKKVKYRDRETEYRDLSEMRQTLAHMKSQLNGTTRAPYKYQRYSRGY